MTHPSRRRILGLFVGLLILGSFQSTIADEVTQVTLTWDPVETTEEHEITKYGVYSKKTGQTKWNKIGEVLVLDTTLDEAMRLSCFYDILSSTPFSLIS
jgi:hypothetical protein